MVAWDCSVALFHRSVALFPLRHISFYYCWQDWISVVIRMFAVASRNHPSVSETGGWSSELRCITVCGKALCGVCLFFGVCGWVGDIIWFCWLVDWCHSVYCTHYTDDDCEVCVCDLVWSECGYTCWCVFAPRVEFTSDHGLKPCDLNKGYFCVFNVHIRNPSFYFEN